MRKEIERDEKKEEEGERERLQIEEPNPSKHRQGNIFRPNVLKLISETGDSLSRPTSNY